MAKNKRVLYSGVDGKKQLLSEKFGKLSDAEYKALWKKHPMKKNGKDYIPQKFIRGEEIKCLKK